MTAVALLLVLAAAFAHALWNLSAKRVRATVPFVWIFTALSSVLYAPLAAWVFAAAAPEGSVPQMLAVAAVSAAIHSAYFPSLQRAYGDGDLSLVYPVARGSGAMFALAGAIALLGERPSPVALGGALAIGVGVVVLADPALLLRGASTRRGLPLALVTGGLIACYTLWDAHAIKALIVPPLLLTWLSDVGRSLLLAPVAASSWAEVRAVWTAHRREALLVAVLSPLAYMLVLSAVALAPVSGVAPAREVSVLVGIVMGVRVLGEGGFERRFAAGTVIVLGLVALTLGGPGA